MDYNKNNFHKENEETNGLPEGIFGKEEQFQAYAPEHITANRQETADRQLQDWNKPAQEANGQQERSDRQPQEPAEQPGQFGSYGQNQGGVGYHVDSQQTNENSSEGEAGSFENSQNSYQSEVNFVLGGASGAKRNQQSASRNQGSSSLSQENGVWNQDGSRNQDSSRNQDTSRNQNSSLYQEGSMYQNSSWNQGNGSRSQENGSWNQGNGSWSQGGASGKKAKRKHRALQVVAAVMAGVLLIGGAAGGGVYIGQKLAADRIEGNQIAENTQPGNDGTIFGGQPETSDQQTIGSAGKPSGVEATATMTDVSEVVDSVTPAIVAINCSADYVTNFWGQQYIQPSQGSGSGIIIGQNKEEVLIVTNNHVVATGKNAQNEIIEVVFGDQSTAPATIKGTEEGSDLAVISVKLSDLKKETLSYIKIATLGDSDALKVGQMAIAIGNALGYGQSTTVGWISALDREIASEDYTMTLIQTDAAINPGNSGGALLNTKGEVIGINSAKYSDQSVEGMGFAIPISKAVPIINDLMNREEIPEEEQAYLGIVGQDVPEVYTERYGMPLGVYVYQVSKGSPAEQAGLNMGDIITAFNGRAVSSMSEMQRILATYRGGDEITLTIQIFEEGEYTEKTLHVTLGFKNQQRAE